MSENLKGILMLASVLAVTVALTGLTIWSFIKRKPDDDDDDPELFV